METSNLAETVDIRDGQGPPPGTRPARDYSDEIVSLGNRLRKLRYSGNMNLEELAERTGLSVGLLSQLERGIGNPSWVTLMKIADALHIQRLQRRQAVLGAVVKVFVLPPHFGFPLFVFRFSFDGSRCWVLVSRNMQICLSSCSF